MERVYTKLNLKWEIPVIYTEESEHGSALKAYLEAEFSESGRYAYDTEEHDFLFKSLFKDGENELRYDLLYLPLDKSVEEAAQRGILKFYNQRKDSICFVTAELQNTHGFTSKYAGFAMLIDVAGPTGGNCWCFLKRNDFLGVLTMNFKLGYGDRNARIAEVMASRSKNLEPVVYRMLLTKKYIEDEYIKYYKGHLKMNSDEIVIRGQDYIDLKNYFEKKEIRNCKIFFDLEKHFKNKVMD